MVKVPVVTQSSVRNAALPDAYLRSSMDISGLKRLDKATTEFVKAKKQQDQRSAGLATQKYNEFERELAGQKEVYDQASTDELDGLSEKAQSFYRSRADAYSKDLSQKDPRATEIFRKMITGREAGWNAGIAETLDRREQARLDTEVQTLMEGAGRSYVAAKTDEERGNAEVHGVAAIQVYMQGQDPEKINQAVTVYVSELESGRIKSLLDNNDLEQAKAVFNQSGRLTDAHRVEVEAAINRMQFTHDVDNSVDMIMRTTSSLPEARQLIEVIEDEDVRTRVLQKVPQLYKQIEEQRNADWKSASSAVWQKVAAKEIPTDDDLAALHPKDLQEFKDYREREAERQLKQQENDNARQVQDHLDRIGSLAGVNANTFASLSKPTRIALRTQEAHKVRSRARNTVSNPVGSRAAQASMKATQIRNADQMLDFLTMSDQEKADFILTPLQDTVHERVFESMQLEQSRARMRMKQAEEGNGIPSNRPPRLYEQLAEEVGGAYPSDQPRHRIIMAHLTGPILEDVDAMERKEQRPLTRSEEQDVIRAHIQEDKERRRRREDDINGRTMTEQDREKYTRILKRQGFAVNDKSIRRLHRQFRLNQGLTTEDEFSGGSNLA